MRSWIDDRVDEVRSLTTRADDGSLWIMVFEDPYGDHHDAMADLDEVMIRNPAWGRRRAARGLPRPRRDRGPRRRG
jgi:hypothetical protein